VKATLRSHLKGQAEIPTEVSAPLLKLLRGLNVKWGSRQGHAIREKILDTLRSDGWSKPVKLDPQIGITVSAMKEGIALCVQFGNMARFYADLLKLQYLYLKGRATAALYILPMKESSLKLGQNIVHFERLCTELDYFQEIIRIPILVVGLED
jgi:hypothetical protein